MTIRRAWFTSLARVVVLIVIAVVVIASLAAPARADLVVAWGDNNFGQLGDGNGASGNLSNVPVPVFGLSSGVTAVAAGGGHSFAIHNGPMVAWGWNDDGQLGDGSNNDSDLPVPVIGPSSNLTDIAGGLAHSLAIVDGFVIAWGRNGEGELGIGVTGGSANVPTPVSGLLDGYTAVAAGQDHSLAIRNGAAMSWGRNGEGQLGSTAIPIGDTSNEPVPVFNLGSGVTDIAAGASHSLAIHNGAAVAWGYNLTGQLGNGASGEDTESGVPVPVTGLGSGVTAVAGGANHSLAIQNGNVYAWGLNFAGELGNDTIALDAVRDTPILALDLPQDLVDVAASSSSSYALSSDGSLWVWGANDDGQLGLGTTGGMSTTPQHLLPPSGFLFTGIDADANSTHVVATMIPEPHDLAIAAMTALLSLPRRRRRWEGSQVGRRKAAA